MTHLLLEIESNRCNLEKVVILDWLRELIKFYLNMPYYAKQADLEDGGVEKLTDAMMEILNRRRRR